MKRVLFFNASMGAAGDMFNAALFSLLKPEEQQRYLETMNALGLPELRVEAEKASDHDIKGWHIHMLIHDQKEKSVHDHSSCDHDGHSHCEASSLHDHTHLYTGEGNHADHNDHHHDDHQHNHHHTHSHDGHSHHHHSGLHEIRHYVEKMPLSDAVKENTLAVFGMIAQAEAKVHGSTPDQIHFHEVGTLDAIADVAGGCLLMEMLHPDKVICTPIRTGYGSVHCMHGILPIPAPATALLLEGVPVFAGDLKGEFCTPTGAALLKYFTGQYGQMPAMIPKKTGYGL